jgi:hypothetical protein
MRKLRKQTTLSIMAMALVMLLTYQAFGQEFTPIAKIKNETTERKAFFEIDLGYSHRFDTDIHHGNGASFNVQSAGAAAYNTLKLNPCYTLDTSLSYEYNDYQFDRNSGHRRFQRKNIFEWNKIHVVSFNSLLKYDRDEKWSFYGGPIINVGAEEGAEIGDSVSGGGVAGFKYIYSPTLTLGAGLAVVSKLEDPAAIAPLVSVDWKFYDKCNLHVGFSDIGSGTGYGVEASWAPVESLILSLGGQEQDNRFRLSDHWQAGHPAKGVASDQFAVLYAKAAWQCVKFASIEGFAGGAINGKLKLENKDGRAIREQDYASTPMLGLRACINF